ncbi:unnamed protein product [Linum tenue]|uniref:Poly(A) RNA polymerase mitochondrial-like central palm domain-containing protein n=1 Tax=Linum tenue TaxID=586396 RepID=A0AAV0JR75_9ROSI|nr:unnamed protein product [Linum tenue]
MLCDKFLNLNMWHRFLQTKMNAPLESTLWDILGVIEPQRDDWLIRQRIVQELQDVVRTIPNLRGATVEPFGSFVSNLFTPWGDLDITVMLDYGSYISVAGKKRKLSLLEDVLRALKEKGGWWRLRFIPNAKVPILKFEKGCPAISGDISIDNLGGQMKSKCLFWLNQIDGRFRPLVLLTCKPAIFPPLLALYPTNALDDLTVTSLPFFFQFSTISLKARDFGICPFTGQWEEIKNNTRWFPRTFALYVEDPFEQPANSARAVSVRNLDRIQEVIQRTQLAILSPNLSWIDIHPLLVKPELSRVILFRKQNQNSGGQMMQLQQQQQPQTRKHVHSPAPVIAARVQNVRPENQLRGWRDGTCHIHELSSKPKQETASNNAVSKESNAKKWRKRGIQQQQRGDVFNSKQQLWRPRSQQS